MRVPWEMALTLDKNWDKNGDVRPSGADTGLVQSRSRV